MEMTAWESERARIDGWKSKAKQAPFVKAPIKLAVAHKADHDSRDPDVIEAYCLKGLAIHRPYGGISGSWRIIHIASGRSIEAAFKFLIDAKVAVLRIAEMVDWTQSGDAVRDAMTDDLYERLSDIRCDPYANI